MTDQRRQTTPQGKPEKEGERTSRGDWRAAANGFGGPGPPPRALPDVSALLMVFEALRRMIPMEVQDQLTALQREFLLTIRALIDWYLERLERGPGGPQVEEIPID